MSVSCRCSTIDERAPRIHRTRRASANGPAVISGARTHRRTGIHSPDHAPASNLIFSKRSDVLKVRGGQLATLAHNVEGELLPLIEVAHSCALDCGNMHEYI